MLEAILLNITSQPTTIRMVSTIESLPQLAFEQSGKAILHMNLIDLPMYECSIEHVLSVGETARLFEHHPQWHGVILTQNSKFLGIISRQRCFEMLGRPYGIEIFAKMTIGDFFKTYTGSDLLLKSDVTLKEGVKRALSRKTDVIYDPIAVEIEPGKYALIDMQTLLLAQYDVMENLYMEVQVLSTRDPLTNLANRRGFFEFALPLLATDNQPYGNLAALMIDIDHFKVTNDLYGHFVGDHVIRSVAEVCQRTLRPMDLLGRFGGEEFIALLPNTSTRTASDVAEIIRENVEQKTIHVNGYHINVTVSIGVSHLQDARGSLDNLLSQADQAMYAAKATGRNNVKQWNPLIACQVRNEEIARNHNDPHQSHWKSSFRTDTARIYDETIEGWAKALEMRDRETEGHAQRVVNLTITLARRCGVKENEMDMLRRGALLHDIGKIAIPDPILFHPGPLSEEEWEVMKKHPIYAYEFLSPITFLNDSMDIPYCHHEHWDGSGYPRGLKGEEIPLSARIFTIVDVWDALLTDRCYRNAWNPQQARAYIASQAGILFDPHITESFLHLLDDILIQT